MNRRYSLDLIERTLRTFVQGALGILGYDSLLGDGADWRRTLIGATIAGVLAVLTAFAAKGVGNPNDASLVK